MPLPVCISPEITGLGTRVHGVGILGKELSITPCDQSQAENKHFSVAPETVMSGGSKARKVTGVTPGSSDKFIQPIGKAQ